MTKRGDVRKFLDDALVSETDDCIFWPFAKKDQGYAVARIDKKTVRINRFVCEKRHGPPPSPKHGAAHSCGKTPCINKRHLSWKTRKGNMEDTLIHGTRNRGERQGHSKLTQSEVIEIKKLIPSMSCKTLGDIYGVSASAIFEIKKGRNWAWL